MMSDCFVHTLLFSEGKKKKKGKGVKNYSLTLRAPCYKVNRG